MEIMEHTITFKINDNLEYLTLSIQEAEELYNILKKVLGKSEVLFRDDGNHWRDYRIKQPEIVYYNSPNIEPCLHYPTVTDKTVVI